MLSLRLKLSLVFILVTLVAVLVVALLVDDAVRSEFNLYCSNLCEIAGMDCMGTSSVAALENTYLDAISDSLWRAGLIAVLGALGLAALFSRLLTGPLNELKTSARRIRDGDLSQRVNITSDDEIGEVAAAFNDMARQLESNEETRRQFLADVVHELRTPLSIVQGNLEAWRDGVVTATPEDVVPVHDEAVLMGRLITDLRDLSLAETGQLELTKELTDIGALISSVVETYTQRAASMGIELRYEDDQGKPLLAEADPGRIRQVLRNLIENALRYTPRGGSVCINAVSTADSAVSVTVRDTGAGIAPEHLPHVFEHFYKADRSRNRSRSGSGIGLAIVRQLVEAHGGSVHAKSEAGAGSTFIFSLPAADTTRLGTA
ncbi:MAG: sensor histidine kinase [Chloroflexota bacterium]